MENSLSTEIGTIKYFVTRAQRRSISMRFADDGSLQISLPNTSKINVNGLIDKHIDWIKKHYSQIISTKNLFGNNYILYKGNKLTMLSENKTGRANVTMAEGAIVVQAQSAKSFNNAVQKFILNNTKEFVRTNIEDKKAYVGLAPSRIKFRKMHRWGTCTSEKAIILNAYLSMLPDELANYVVAHEVSHLRHLNHSKSFWKLVSEMIPEYKRLRKEMKFYNINQTRLIPENMN